MKTSQWLVALGVLVVMVFVITFAMNFIGDRGKPSVPTTRPENLPGPGSEHNLTFFATSLPADPAGTIYYEERKSGWQDFAFMNPHADKVKIGLNKKNCKCASVQLVLADPAWKTRSAAIWAASEYAPLATGDYAGPASARLWLLDRDKELQNLQDGLAPVAKLEPNGRLEDTAVPGHALGWIRLEWAEDKTGPQIFSGELWVGSPQSGLNAVVEARVRFVPPLRVEDTDVNVGELSERDLVRKPFEISVHVWSSTRPSLRLKTQAIPPLRYDEKRPDPFVVGEPIPLSREECEKLQRTAREAGTVLCAYRIPVKLVGRSTDATGGEVGVDLGSFRRRFRVWSDEDAGVEPMEVSVTGSVQGSVTVNAKSENARISLGTFDSSAGSAPQSALLSASKADVKLVVDQARTPEFLRGGVRLEPLPNQAGLPRWKLYVQVKPDAARGSFPRQDDVLYRDSAVYLKTEGEVAQNIRIPVDGIANER